MNIYFSVCCNAFWTNVEQWYDKVRGWLSLLLLLVITVSMVNGQEAGLTKSLNLNIGHNQMIEGNLHSRVFYGLDYAVAFATEREGDRLSGWSATLGGWHAKTRLESGLPSITGRVGLDCHHAYKVYKSTAWCVYTGFAVGMDYHISYFVNWDDSHLYWANFLGLYFYQAAVYEPMVKHKLLGRFALAPLMVLSRPESIRDYKIDDLSFGGIMNSLHYSPEVRPVTQSLDCRLSIEYQYERRRKIMPYVQYSFRYMRLSTSYSEVRQVVHHTIGLRWDL